MAEPFTFAIALAPRCAVSSWRRVEALLGLTLQSLRAQTDADYRVWILGHDRPSNLGDDPRVRFLRAGWAAAPSDPANSDAARKKHALCSLALEDGGGLFMFLDADDWADVRLVEAARASVGPEDAGALITRGHAVDVRHGRSSWLPGPGAQLQFHQLCGSSTIARLRPAAARSVDRDPCSALGSHHRWPEAAQALGLDLAQLPVEGAYIVNTSENHSERHGPYAAWRRELNAGMLRHGRALDRSFLRRFGLRQAHLDGLQPAAVAS